ncbi:MAG: addiction module protein [Opitutales bacterium]
MIQKQDSVAQALNWPIEDRLELVASLWDSISETVINNPLASEQKAELARRLDAHAKRDGKGDLSWKEVRARLTED